MDIEQKVKEPGGEQRMERREEGGRGILKEVKGKGGDLGMARESVVRMMECSKNKLGGDIMKRMIVLVLLVLVSGLTFGVSPDTVVLTVTPVFNLSVNISSTTNTFGTGTGGAGNVVLGTSRTICVGEIQNDGNVTSKWQKKASQVTEASAGDTWTLLENPSTATGENTFQLLAITTGTDKQPDLSSGPGGTDDQMILGNSSVTLVGFTNYSDLTEGGGVSPVHPITEKRSLWVSILMPTNITTSGTQSITLSVQAKVK